MNSYMYNPLIPTQGATSRIFEEGVGLRVMVTDPTRVEGVKCGAPFRDTWQPSVYPWTDGGHMAPAVRRAASVVHHKRAAKPSVWVWTASFQDRSKSRHDRARKRVIYSSAVCPKQCINMLTPLGLFFFFFYCVIRKLSLKYFNVINTTYPTSSIYYIHQKPSRKISETSCETTAINQNFGERFILSVCNVSKYKIKHV